MPVENATALVSLGYPEGLRQLQMRSKVQGVIHHDTAQEVCDDEQEGQKVK